jgi:hypothetical protein
MTRYRIAGAAALAASAALLATGCMGGGDSSADAPAPAATAPAASAAPIAVTPATPGNVVRAGADTPKNVAGALEGSHVVVIAFVVDGAADDASVAEAVREARSAEGGEAVDWFVYRVGKDRFGDLADVLGVTETPSVSVIGRDRVLVNQWSGLVDADIVRQSVSDAKDRPAANLAAAGAELGPSSTAGAALAKKVDAATAKAEGFRVKGSFAVAGAGSFDLTVTARRTPASWSGTFAGAGVRFEATGTAKGAHVRVVGASCWAEVPGTGIAPAAATDPGAGLAGATVGTPRREGALTLLEVTRGGQSVTYAIDRASGELREVRTQAGTLSFEALDTAPEMPDASPVCKDPSEALKGLPAALGGVS